MEQIRNICRLCLATTNKFINIFSDNSAEECPILNLINDYLKITITKCEFSNYICEDCNIKLIDFNDFAILIKRNNDNWNKTYNSASSNVNINAFTSVSETFKNEVIVIDNSIVNNDKNKLDVVISNTNSVIQTNTFDSTFLKNEQTYFEKNDANIVEYFDNIDEESVDEIAENLEDVSTEVSEQKFKQLEDSVVTKKNPKRRSKCKSEKYPETANDIQIRKFYKYECDICQNHPEITTFRCFKTHCETNHSTVAYIKCCGKKFTRPYTVVEHIKEHLMPDCLVCPTCKKKLRTRRTLMLHMDKHVPMEKRPFKCNYCDMRFMRNHFLQQHEIVHLSTEQLKYICDLCGKRYPTDWRLKIHLNCSHSDVKPFVCEVCAKSFKLKVQLQGHMYTHSSKKAAHKQCEYCGIWLRSPKSYYGHVKEKHNSSAPKNFPCDKCTHVSPTKKALYAHSVNKHGPKKHNCQYCSEAFSSSSLLKSHIIKHTGPGEPIKCPLCPKTFSFRSGYYSHKKKIHTPNTEKSTPDN